MKAYVINLPRSRLRRASMTEQLDRTGLRYEFIEGVDGHALTPSEWTSLVDQSIVARNPHWLTPGQVGCALSHLRTHRRILDEDDEEGDVALILEDDAIVPPAIGDLVGQIVPHMYGKEVVLLYFRSHGVCRFSSEDAIQLNGAPRVVYPIEVRAPITTAAYLISREACRGLSEVILPVAVGADGWAKFYELGAIDSLRCVLPRPVGVRKDFKSTIEYAGPRSLRMGVTSFVARHRLFPALQLLTLNRHLVEHRMSKTAVVPERSPIAVARDTTPS